MLLIVLVFNFIGYKFLLNYYEQQFTNNLEKNIDQLAFNENDLREITIPLNMPYYSDSKMENISGEIELNGNHYQYVKRKIENNILHIWCLNNIEKNKIKSLKSDIAKASSENNSSEKNKSSTTVKTFQTEYLEINKIVFKIQHSISSANKILLDNKICISLFNPSESSKPPENKIA